jgi:hypothetical protein
MYAYIDRPVAELERFEADVLHATRKWVHAVSHVPSLGKVTHGRATSFELVMEVLHRESTGSLVINRPCHTLIGEFEAVLLGLWHQIRNGLSAQARATAAMIISPAKVDLLIQAMHRILVNGLRGGPLG